jgi:site-specific DNA recombinase
MKLPTLGSKNFAPGGRLLSARAAIYARVSTEDQARHGYSLESQLEACRKYAQERGWVVVAEEVDGGVSGASLDRPGLNRIRDLAQAGEFDFLVVYDLDRLSRKVVHQMLIEEELARAGVSIHYVLGDYRDDDEGRLQKQIRAAIAEYERAKMAERVARGKLTKAKRGLWLAGGRHTPYGYRYNAGHLVVAEEEAQVIRQIFEWFVNGCSIRGIVRRLDEMGFKPPRGKHWAKSTVSRILNNEAYVGTIYYNRRQGTPNGKKWRPKEEWIPISVPPIIDRETWEEAQNRLEFNRKYVRRQPRHPYLLSGMLICAECGYAYGGCFAKGKRYYYDGDKKKHPALRADKVEEAVWSAIAKLLLNPQAILAGYEAMEAEAKEQREKLEARLEALLKLQGKAKQRLEALTDAFLDPDIGMEKSEYIRRRREIKQEINELEREIQNLKHRLSKETITREHIATIEKFASKIAERIDSLSWEEKREVLKLLRVRGKVHHDERGTWIELEGLFPPTEVLVSSTTSCL